VAYDDGTNDDTVAVPGAAHRAAPGEREIS
jgi:hypothetical protein